MGRLFLFAGIAAALVGVLLAGPVFAGGWAVVTLLEFPEDVTAGQPVEVHFAVRQHGQMLVPGLSPAVKAVHTETRETLAVEAQPGEQDGYYRTSLVFPRPGVWRWSIEGFSEQQMPDILVKGELPVSSASSAATPAPGTAAFIASALLGSLGALMILSRRPLPWAVLLLAAALASGAYGFTYAKPGITPAATAEPDILQVERGKALFLAKGCVSCHLHNETKDQLSTKFGPELTHFRASPEYLRTWLADPAGVKPGTLMPKLELSSAEIEALIAFINQDTAGTGKDNSVKDAAANMTAKAAAACPVTLPPKPPYSPPPPYPPEHPYEGYVWYGSEALWTSLPTSSTWYQLGFGEKVFWWRAGYSGSEEPRPGLTVTAQRLDKPAPPYEAGQATNAYHPDFQWAMLVGVQVPEPGCWEITGQYEEQSLSFVVRVEPEVLGNQKAAP